MKRKYHIFCCIRVGKVYYYHNSSDHYPITAMNTSDTTKANALDNLSLVAGFTTALTMIYFMATSLLF